MPQMRLLSLWIAAAHRLNRCSLALHRGKGHKSAQLFPANDRYAIVDACPKAGCRLSERDLRREEKDGGGNDRAHNIDDFGACRFGSSRHRCVGHSGIGNAGRAVAGQSVSKGRAGAMGMRLARPLLLAAELLCLQLLCRPAAVLGTTLRRPAMGLASPIRLASSLLVSECKRATALRRARFLALKIAPQNSRVRNRPISTAAWQAWPWRRQDQIEPA